MITDDDLLLYYYRELDSAERTRIGTAIANDPQLAQRLQALVSRLDAAATIPEVPVPEDVQQRWRAALERASDNQVAVEAVRTPRARRSFFSEIRWQAAAAAIAVVALVFIVQLAKQPETNQIAEGVTPTVSPAPAEDATAYERGLKWHLASTERQLSSLHDAAPEERARLVETIIAQNRMYALAAERAGEPQLARVLRAFAPVLESVASGGETSASGIAQLNFELRVMQGRLGAEAAASPKAQPTTL